MDDGGPPSFVQTTLQRRTLKPLKREQPSPNLRFQTSTRNALEQPFAAENATPDARDDKMLSDLRERIQRNKGTQIIMESAGPLAEHPTRTLTSHGSRLPRLREHKSMPLFDTESKCQQRDITLAKRKEGESGFSEQGKLNKATRSKSQIRLAHYEGEPEFNEWKKCNDYQVPELSRKPHQRRDKNAGSTGGERLWETEADAPEPSAYVTTAGSMQENAKDGLKLPHLNDPMARKERRKRLAGTHWSFGEIDDDEKPKYWNKRLAPQPKAIPFNHPGVFLPNKTAAELKSINKKSALNSGLSMGEDPVTYETTMQDALKSYPYPTGMKATNRHAYKAMKTKAQRASVNLGDHPAYM